LRAFLLPCLFGCDPTSVDSADSGGGDSGVVAPADCTPDDANFSGLQAEVTEMPTVLRASWGVGGTQGGAVRFVDSVGRWVQNAPGDGLMVGLLPNTDVPWQVVVGEGEEKLCSSVQSTRTGPLSTPDIEVEGAMTGGYVVTTLIDSGTLVVMLDALGQVVWALEGDTTPDEPGIRARLSRDRQSILFHFRSGGPDQGAITRVGLDGSVIEVVPVPGIEIDFDELPDGRLAALTTEMRRYDDGRVLRGDRVTLVDNGTSEVIWSVLDVFGPPGSYEVVDPTDSVDFVDLAHCNGLSFDGEDLVV
jgi:hypothetical protein